MIKVDSQYKSRLVAKEFMQVEEIDFQKTFSSVIRYEAICFLLAHATLEDWEIMAMDIKTTFLYGKLNKKIYIEQSEGFVEKGQEKKVCCLKKAIYSLKQALCTWNKKLHNALLKHGFRHMHSDVCIYIHDQANTILIVYVNDLLHLGPSMDFINEHKKKLTSLFQMCNLGLAKNFLGMRIEHDRKKLMLTLDQ